MEPTLSTFLNGFNWIDLIVIILIAVYAFEGYGSGFLRSSLDLISFILSFLAGLFFYPFASNLITDIFRVPIGFSNAIGFFLVAISAEVLLSRTLMVILMKLPGYVSLNTQFKKLGQGNNVLGVFPGILSAFVLITFILTMLTTLPTAPVLKQAVLNSKTGPIVISQSLGLEDVINKVFGQAVSEALTFMTVEPKSQDSLDLHIRTKNLSTDRQAEKQMLDMVNSERQTKGLKTLFFDERLAETGRKHCRDMFERGYFSHYTPEGLSPFDRMAQDDITYSFAGENLAFAPSTKLAHEGLMRSTGHRENILSGNFGRVGIGVIDGGVYGKMFCQEFTD